MISPRIKNIINEYYHNGIKGVENYLTQPDMSVDPSTWAYQLLKTINDHQYVTAQMMIELLSYKFIFKLHDYEEHTD